MFARPLKNDNSPSKPSTSTDGDMTNVNSSSSSSNTPITAGSNGHSSFYAMIFEDNPYFAAGFGLMGLGVAATIFRRSSTVLADLTRRRLLVSLEIPIRDRSYPWFLEWMSTQTKLHQSNPSKQQRKGLLRLGMPRQSHQLSVETNYIQHDNGSSDVLFSLVPGPGTHWFQYRGAWMQVVRERDAKLVDLSTGSPWETVKLTALSSNRHLFPLLLAEARDLATKGQAGKVVIYTAWGVEWKPFGVPRAKRELKSVVLSKGVSEKIEEDLRGFLGRGKWYAERGIPYRRGYLLHGPPGSGKTSFIQALAGKLSYNICVLNLSQRGLMDDKLTHLLMNTPERSIILLEDIDAAFNKRVQTSEDGYQSSVTFSGLLNALDGVASSEERIIFMTTNHIERLDQALIRPGRVDMMEFIGNAGPEQARRLFVQFYGRGGSSERLVESDDAKPVELEVIGEEKSLKEGEEQKEKEKEDAVIRSFAKTLEDRLHKEAAQGREPSMASLQGHFIRYSAEEAITRLDELFIPPPSPSS